ncbi:glycosyl transferase family 90 [Acidithiobacillus thiooxidans]|uniref:Glycosyl transferase CAP10 domain-containing protein n=1 Tax=Acidithiobacillus thiooxidans TaxID=930 RepID=A0A1C2IHX1_ACITH|nr:glycosyl transferase family 90 [Acidithiobacillus thiooxidans]OCX75578.1 hypothetical protein A6M23_02185 [Acidithiobacillus thiooxidans]OCX78228.1 hypothetical protein A6P08_20150 [Acidithiobacillus thiooxidans]
MKRQFIARFLGSDTALCTEVGQREGQALVSTGQAGYLLYGPYMALEPGSYRVVLYGSADAIAVADATTDVCMAEGQRIITPGPKLRATTGGQEGLLAAISYVVEENCRDIEVRVRVTERCRISIALVEFYKISSNSIKSNSYYKGRDRENVYDKFFYFMADEIGWWRSNNISQNAYYETINNYLYNDMRLFLFRCNFGSVEVIENKLLDNLPTIYVQDLRNRAILYKSFISDVLSIYHPELVITIPFLIDDLSIGYNEIPVFSFQKTIQDKMLLAPDVDALANKFYEEPDLLDAYRYEDKTNSIIFAGSTTGVDENGRSIHNTLETIYNNERVNIANHFKNSDEVLVRLPNVVQCDDDTKEYLLSQPFCTPTIVTMAEQYKCKCLLSMDGNGATCSRVMLALRSNSVLVKCLSNYTLWYFKALIPWDNYIPVACTKDIEDVYGALASDEDNIFPKIANNQKMFYNCYLRQSDTYTYFAVMLNEFNFIVNHSEDYYERTKKLINDTACPLFIVAHLAEFGDMCFFPMLTAGEVRSQKPIEGFKISGADSSIYDSDIEYQAVDSSGTTTPWCQGGIFCGSRGNGTPLVGFRVRLKSDQLDIKYRGYFLHGAQPSWIDSGEWCISNGHGALEAFDVRLVDL